jgi:peptidyl-prolyl cis-trans isomerase A (cyclophilin A)
MGGNRLGILSVVGSGIACIALGGWLFAAEQAAEQDDFLPPVGLEEGWYARIETSKGLIIVRLLPEQAPQSVAHFAGMAEGTLEWIDPVLGEPQKGRYYDGIEVDRAKAGERFEAGGLDADPSRPAPELYVSPAEGKGPVNFGKSFRMGLTGAYGARISAVKFFITAAPLPYFNGRYPCLGTVVEGQEVVRHITEVKTFRQGRPIDPIQIHKIRVFSVGGPDPLPEPQPYVPRLKSFGPRE